MEKFILLIFVLGLSTMSLFAQTFFERNNNRFSMGVQVGKVYNPEVFKYPTYIINVSYYGVYLDIGGCPRSHRSDVRVDKWKDSSYFTFHVGYQLPVLNWLRVTPLVGYYCHKSGYTDGYDYTVDKYGIHNRFDVTDQKSGFDFGGNLQFDINRFSIFCTFTKKLWYAGLGFNVMF